MCIVLNQLLVLQPLRLHWIDLDISEWGPGNQKCVFDGNWATGKFWSQLALLGFFVSEHALHIEVLIFILAQNRENLFADLFIGLSLLQRVLLRLGFQLSRLRPSGAIGVADIVQYLAADHVKGFRMGTLDLFICLAGFFELNVATVTDLAACNRFFVIQQTRLLYCWVLCSVLQNLVGVFKVPHRKRLKLGLIRRIVVWFGQLA